MKENPTTKLEFKLIRLQLKLESIDVNVNTTKSNYIDPRIIISFCNKTNIDIDNFYTKTE